MWHFISFCTDIFLVYAQTFSWFFVQTFSRFLRRIFLTQNGVQEFEWASLHVIRSIEQVFANTSVPGQDNRSSSWFSYPLANSTFDVIFYSEEVLLLFCSLICHYEWIHTSSVWRGRFLEANNRPPTCDRMWLFRVVAPVKEREQYPHLKSFLLIWMTACARNLQTLLKEAGRWPHW